MQKFEKNFHPGTDNKDNSESTLETVDFENNSPEVVKSKKMPLQKSSTMSSGFFLSIKDGKSHLPKSKESIMSNIRRHLRGSSKDYNSQDSHDERIKGFKPKKVGDESKHNDDSSSEGSNFDDNYDNYLRVTFKSDFLYQIGKVAAKSGYMLEKALKFLNDFLLIINFYKQDMETKSYRKLRAHAIYYMGIAYFQLGDSELAEKILRNVQTDLIDIHGKSAKKVQKVDTILSKYFTERFNPMAQLLTDYF
jgi:hypothetical protein